MLDILDVFEIRLKAELDSKSDTKDVKY